MSAIKQSVVVLCLEDSLSQLQIELKENQELVSAKTTELLQKDSELLQIKKEIANDDEQLSKMQSDSVLISEQINAMLEKIRVENVRLELEKQENIKREQEEEKRMVAQVIISLTKKRKMCEYQMVPGETCTTKCYKGSVCAKHAKRDFNQRNIKEIGLFATRSSPLYGDQTHLNLDSGDPSTGKYTYCITMSTSKGVQFRNSVRNNPNVVLRLFHRDKQSSSFVEYKVLSFKDNTDNQFCRVDLTVDQNGCDVGCFKSSGGDTTVEFQKCHFKKMALLKFYDDPNKNINSSFNTTFGVHYKSM